jgi:hypothetical protein
VEERTVELNDGYGDGSGDGSGYGYGYGYGSGYGYGYDDGSGYEIRLKTTSQWRAYHYIERSDGILRMRNGQAISVGDVSHENRIVMCQRGLHASFTQKDAARYKPPNSVLTRVAVWGRIIIGRDKLVATDRQLLEVLENPKDT